MFKCFERRSKIYIDDKKIYIIELINEIDDVDIYNILIYIYNIIFKAFNISMNTLIEIIENEINNTNKDEEKIFLLCFCNSIDIKCKLTNEQSSMARQLSHDAFNKYLKYKLKYFKLKKNRIL